MQDKFMNIKNLFFSLAISLIYFFNINAQTETLYYTFHKEKDVYFLLELKKRPIETLNDFEWSWGPSEERTDQLHEFYEIIFQYKNYFEPDVNQQWVKKEEIEKILSEYWQTETNSKGFSNFKLKTLLDNQTNLKNYRKKRIYYKMVKIFKENDELKEFLINLSINALNYFKNLTRISTEFFKRFENIKEEFKKVKTE